MLSAATWFKPPDSRLNAVSSRASASEFQRTFRTGSRASGCRQFLPFRNFNVTRQDVTVIIEFEDVRRLRRASRVALAFGLLDDDAHGAASIVCARLGAGLRPVQDQIFDPEHMAARSYRRRTLLDPESRDARQPLLQANDNLPPGKV